MFKKVAIVGTGLIGGSLALAIKEVKLAECVVGISRQQKNLNLAKKIGAIDKGSLSLDILKDADLVVLATPISVILNLAPKIAQIIQKNCIVTDVASTKEEIAGVLEKIFTHYVGTHPLAGSEKRSIANAAANLFHGSACIITSTKKTDKIAFKKVESLWNKIGAKTMALSPSTHDKILSITSHLPHIAAFSLIKAVPDDYLKLSSGGLKDTTRIAGSDSEIWVDIFLSNQKNILQAIGVFEKNIKEIKSAIQRKDKVRLAKILRDSKLKREKLG